MQFRGQCVIPSRFQEPHLLPCPSLIVLQTELWQLPCFDCGVSDFNKTKRMIELFTFRIDERP